ncbi:MAG: DUF2800 domain-containing protein [Clostridiales bacterium]|nr:DUF2800 domain-containing protein [Clostridiales bacterium]
MIDHANRTHALLSASSAHRWMACTPSAVLESQFPDTTSDAAREGTLAHEFCEGKLRKYFLLRDAAEKRKATSALTKLKKDPLYQPEMEGYTDQYLDEVKRIALGFPAAPYVAVETRLDLTRWVPEGFGTADCVMICGSVLHVVDFKYGKGVPVAAEGNPQMQLYALGAYAAYSMLYPIETVRMTIIQPRIQSEADTAEMPLNDLLAFGEKVREKAALAIKGEGEFHPGESQCRFCRARAQCRARAEENVRLAGFIMKKPPLIRNDEVGAYLRQGEDVARWLQDLKDYALSECLAGREVSGWKAVEGRGSRAWTDEEAAFKALEGHGVPETMLYEKKPLTLAAVEKMLGKANFASCAGEYVVKNPGKPALVPETDRRPAITNAVSAAEAFGGKP